MIDIISCDIQDETNDTTSCVWIEDESCKVIMAALPHFCKDPTMEEFKAIRKWLPCEYCYGAICQARQLEGSRLGRLGRRALLMAPPLDNDEWKIIPPEREGRAADEANRRAIRRLGEAGLLHLDKIKVERKVKVWYWRNHSDWRERDFRFRRRNFWKRAVKLSPLGEAVAKHLRALNGQTLRWESHLIEDFAQSTQRPLSFLLETCHKRTIEDSEAASYYGRLAAMFGNREAASDLLGWAGSLKSSAKAIEEAMSP